MKKLKISLIAIASVLGVGGAIVKAAPTKAFVNIYGYLDAAGTVPITVLSEEENETWFCAENGFRCKYSDPARTTPLTTTAGHIEPLEP